MLIPFDILERTFTGVTYIDRYYLISIEENQIVIDLLLNTQANASIMEDITQLASKLSVFLDRHVIFLISFSPKSYFRVFLDKLKELFCFKSVKNREVN